jgi:hypothetical protein
LTAKVSLESGAADLSSLFLTSSLADVVQRFGCRRYLLAVSSCTVPVEPLLPERLTSTGVFTKTRTSFDIQDILRCIVPMC